MGDKISLGTTVEEVANAMVSFARIAATSDNWEGYRDICIIILERALARKPEDKENQDEMD